MKDNLEEIIIEFFEGELSTDQAKDLMQKRKTSNAVEQLFQKYTLLYDEIENQEAQFPSKSLESNFEKLLNQEKRLLATSPTGTSSKQGRLRKLFLYSSVAAVFLLLVLATGIFISKNSQIRDMNDEIASIRSEMKLLLNNNSTSVRIQAVSLSYDLEKPDEDIIQALVHTMNSDPSENVKLASVNALGKFAKYEPVKQELIKALKTHESPYVQIKIIAILSNIKAKDVIPLLDELIENKETEFLVKAEATLGRSKIIEI